MEPAGKGGEAVRLRKEPRDSKDNTTEDCPVCVTAFDDTLRRPRTLPCGHTFCTPCINRLVQEDQLVCPSCRITHAVPKVGQFPISYITEAFIKRLEDSTSSSHPPTPEKDNGKPTPSSGQKWPAEFSKAICSMLQEQESKILDTMDTCQKLQEQISQYQTDLADWGQTQQSLEDRLQALMDQSKGARMLIRQEESKMADKKEEVQRGEQQMNTLLQTLRKVETRQKAFQVIDESDRCTDQERQKAEECRKTFLDVDTVTTVNKVMKESSAALEAVETTQGAHGFSMKKLPLLARGMSKKKLLLLLLLLSSLLLPFLLSPEETTTTSPGIVHEETTTTSPGNVHEETTTTSPGNVHEETTTTSSGNVHEETTTTSPGNVHEETTTTANFTTTAISFVTTLFLILFIYLLFFKLRARSRVKGTREGIRVRARGKVLPAR